MFIMPFLRLICEVLLLVVMLYAGFRELSELAILLIVFRLCLSFVSRILQIPDFIEEEEKFAAGVIVGVLKIFSEVGIFFSVKEDINISTEIISIILFLMICRNVSEAWSLLAIEFDE